MDLLSAPREFFRTNGILQNSGLQKISPEKLIDLAIESHIVYLERKPLERGEPFFIADLGQVTRQHRKWKQNLPEVHPYYGKLPSKIYKHIADKLPAVKCNSDPTLLKCLADLGASFDCASVQEMQTVLNLGIDPAFILFANPCKSFISMDFARQVGVMRTTFDNFDELEKIKLHMPQAELLLRIYASDESALIPLGDKFGAPLDTTEDLLLRAWDLQLNVVGVSFHVGKTSLD